MKWIKHLTDSWNDERIAALVDEGGLALYGLYWRVQEIIASQMEGKDPNCSVTYSVTRWSVLLSVRGSHVRHLLGQLAKKDLVTVEWIESDIRVTNCKLLKYRDEYSKKSRHTPESVGVRIEGEGEQKERERENARDVPPLHAAPVPENPPPAEERPPRRTDHLAPFPSSAPPGSWLEPEPAASPPNGRVNPMGADAGVEMELATWLFEELGIPADFGTRDMAAQAIRGLVKKGAPSAKDAADHLLEQARKSTETVNRFWFQEQKYLPQRRKVSAVRQGHHNGEKDL